MNFEPRSASSWGTEARQELAERPVREFEVDEDVIRRRDVDPPASHRTTANAARGRGDRAHRLDPADRPEQCRQRMQPIDAVVEQGTDTVAVERRRIARVFAPGGRPGIGVVGHHEGR